MSELDPSPRPNSKFQSPETTPNKPKERRLRKKSSFYEQSRKQPSQPKLPELKLAKYDSLASQIVDSESADSDDKMLASRIEELEVQKNTKRIGKRHSLKKQVIPDSPMFDHFKFKAINVNTKPGKFI